MIVIAASLYLPEHVTMMARRAWFYYAGDESGRDGAAAYGSGAQSAGTGAGAAAVGGGGGGGVGGGAGARGVGHGMGAGIGRGGGGEEILDMLGRL